MEEYTVIGIDLAKTKFHIAALNHENKVAMKRAISRDDGESKYKLSGMIDFGSAAMGDPACDLVIAWTYLNSKARDVFVSEMGLDNDTWLRARAWVLWKATFELCNIADKNSPEARLQKKIIERSINE